MTNLFLSPMIYGVPVLFADAALADVRRVRWWLARGAAMPSRRNGQEWQQPFPWDEGGDIYRYHDEVWMPVRGSAREAA